MQALVEFFAAGLRADPRPIVTRQPGTMREHVARRHVERRIVVVQLEVRQVIAHRFIPRQFAVAHQGRQCRHGERFGDRGNRLHRLGRHRQFLLKVAHAVATLQNHLAIFHHGDGNARRVPFFHFTFDEFVEISQCRVGDDLIGRIGTIKILPGRRGPLREAQTTAKRACRCEQ